MYIKYIDWLSHMEKKCKKCSAYQAHSTTGLWRRHRRTNTEEKQMSNESKEDIHRKASDPWGQKAQNCKAAGYHYYKEK